MAPRKGKAAKPAPKAKPISKPKAARPSLGSSSRPTMPYTSLAARKRRQPTCSMASLRNLENEVTIEQNFIGLFGAQSDNHYTWGKTEAKPIAAIRRRGAIRSPARFRQHHAHSPSDSRQMVLNLARIPLD